MISFICVPKGEDFSVLEKETLMYILLLIKNLSINRNLYSLGLRKNEVLYITARKSTNSLFVIAFKRKKEGSFYIFYLYNLLLFEIYSL
jgi:hypothetical protein